MLERENNGKVYVNIVHEKSRNINFFLYKNNICMRMKKESLELVPFLCLRFRTHFNSFLNIFTD